LFASESLGKGEQEMSGKRVELGRLIRQMESVVVAYSGGVDSTLLPRVAHDGLNKAGILAL
jgi:PP-loop superfamily ATP-utilizing enzyme